jgi:acetamidase/formamidase
METQKARAVGRCGLKGLTRLAMAICCLELCAPTTGAQNATYTLKPTPQTVEWGHYDANAAPVLKIKFGDTVEIQTLLTNEPEPLEKAGVPPDQIEQSLRDIVAQVKDKGPGGHILTGPICVEGAEPGDVLEVRIVAIKLAIPYAYNGFGPRSGIFPNEFPYPKTKIIPLDANSMVAHFGDGIEIPLHRSSGAWASRHRQTESTAARRGFTREISTIKSWWQVQRCTFRCTLAVALFEVGDGHAGQGDGEVDVTALETSLIGTFQFVVRKDLHFHWPRAETPTQYMTMGLDPDLNEATKMAVREMIDYLTTEKHLSRDDAYILSSVAADLRITQLVDGTKGAHMMIPKAIFAH